jgi:hypothetical protein
MVFTRHSSISLDVSVGTQVGQKAHVNCSLDFIIDYFKKTIYGIILTAHR